MITLLGVGHVFDIGRAVRAEVLARRPMVVALELDAARYQALMSPQPRPRGCSVLGLLAQFQVRIANQYGVRVGDEMVAAARAAREVGSEVALIDQDSAVILRRVWREMAGRERLLLPGLTIGGLFTPREHPAAGRPRVYQEGPGVIPEFDPGTPAPH